MNVDNKPDNKKINLGINLTNFKQQKVNSRESSLEKIEENRQLNSKRQFKIKKNKGNGKGLKSPSDFTNCGKSVVSLFST